MRATTPACGECAQCQPENDRICDSDKQGEHPKRTPGADEYGQVILARDIAQNKRSKLRGVWNYELREIQTSIGLPFGVIKAVIPRDYFKEGGSPKRDAEDAIGDALGKIKVIYVNTKSKLNLAPTGMVSIAINMLSPEGAQILARGYAQ